MVSWQHHLYLICTSCKFHPMQSTYHSPLAAVICGRPFLSTLVCHCSHVIGWKDYGQHLGVKNINIVGVTHVTRASLTTSFVGHKNKQNAEKHCNVAIFCSHGFMATLQGGEGQAVVSWGEVSFPAVLYFNITLRHSNHPFSSYDF